MTSEHEIAIGKHGPLVGAIDQGTSSSRFLVFSCATGELITYHQEEVAQYFPVDGWVEQKPSELLESVLICIEKAIENLEILEINPSDIKAIGIANQRETTLVWDRKTGKPLYNAIVWLDARTTETVENLLDLTPGRNKNYFKDLCGLPLSTYFSAVKLKWLFDNVEDVKVSLENETLLFGNVDSWLLWNLTGGTHKTDVTNASRTLLMNLRTLDWDPPLCKFFGVPLNILPEIRSSSEIFGYITKGPLMGVPISGILGDQQAALVGQMCLKKGLAKNTYGTGCFLLQNTGTQIVQSEHGLITTVAYKLGSDAPATYALEGSVAIAGAAVRWLRDNLKIINRTSEFETLVKSVKDCGGVYFVPAFSGLFAPYWRPDARGIICGLSQHSTQAHIARAAMDAVCFQTREILSAMEEDSGIKITSLLVDGGMTENDTLLQTQANLAGITVVRPSMVETTALGAAISAGLAKDVNIIKIDSIPQLTTDEFKPTILTQEREDRFEHWKMAIERSMSWEVPRHKKPGPEKEFRLLSSVPPAVFAFTSFITLLIAEYFNSSHSSISDQTL